MSPIGKALDDIKHSIPPQVLQEAFKPERSDWRNVIPTSIDEQILLRVIKSRVLVDTNLIGGGITTVIDLSGLSPVFTDNYTTVFKIPRKLSSDRDILTALEVGYFPVNDLSGFIGAGVNTYSSRGMNSLTNGLQRVIDSFSTIPNMTTANVDLIATNTILIKDQYRMSGAYFLRCVISQDENLSNLNPRSYLVFSEICILAVKAYIYNTMLVKIDRAFLEGGQELGSMKNYIESLADSNEMYMTALREKWAAVAFFNDRESVTSYIKNMVRPSI